MFEVGFTELLLIFALALLVLGPQKLPKLAQQVGRWVGRARAMARQFRDQLEEEAHNLETKVSINPDIDTSLDTKRPPTPPTGAASETPPAATPAPYQDIPEDFYPPDHHMHPDNQAVHGAPDTPETGSPETAAAPDAPTPTSQGELDLTTPANPPKES